MNMKEPHLALRALVKVCARKTGQSYKVRGLLYSLWNGKPFSLLEIITLDREIRADILGVLNHFGHPCFFYDQIKAEFTEVGLFDWFTEEGDQ
jgi:hypothetical protein